MSDPFAILREELVSAAERAAVVPPVSPRRRWRWLRTAVPILVSVGVTAAVVAFAIEIHAQRVSRSSIKPSPSNIEHRRSQRARTGRVRLLTIRHLASGRLSGGDTFDIAAERYRWRGRVYFAINIATRAGAGGSFTPAQTRGVVVWEDMWVCSHPRAVLLYGLLRASAASVRVRDGNATIVLRQVLIPPVLHAGGVLVYAVLSRPPREVIVQRPGPVGKRLFDDRLPSNERMCAPPNGLQGQNSLGPWP
jgi:hypothetical protein